MIYIEATLWLMTSGAYNSPTPHTAPHTDPWLENPHDLHRGNTLVNDLRYIQQSYPSPPPSH